MLCCSIGVVYYVFYLLSLLYKFAKQIREGKILHNHLMVSLTVHGKKGTGKRGTGKIGIGKKAQINN